MTLKRNFGMVALAALAMAACEPSSNETLVARAGDYEFTVARAVELLGPNAELPNQPQVVASLADLWIDYTLLADAALNDPDFLGVDVSDLVEQQVQGEMILALQDSMVRPDTLIAEDELRTLYQQEAPGLRVRARHILMGVPPQSTEAQRDSVRARMEEILGRVRAGEDFATLAQNISQDRGSGAQGGDLGEFGIGEMVRPFEQAAFALEPGEVSEVVETPYGFHIIKSDGKVVPSFEEGAEDFRASVVARRFQEAESVYVAQLQESAGVEVVEGAGQLVKDITTDAAGQLAPRAANRALVRFRGGTLSVGEFVAFLESRPQVAQLILNSTPQAIEEDLLKGLAQREVFIQAARDAGLDKSAEHRDSLATEVRSALAEGAELIGVKGIVVPEGMTAEEAVQASVILVLRGIVGGTVDPLPLGALGLALRKDRRVELFEAGIMDAVNRIDAIRGPAVAADSAQAAPAPGPDTAAAADAGGGA